MSANLPVVEATISAVSKLSSSGRPSLVSAAKVLRTSPRTLQRRLSSAGVSFSELLERNTTARACELIAATDEEISSIAARLGYRDPSSFSRAFRRWTGVSPRRYRHMRQNANPTTNESPTT